MINMIKIFIISICAIIIAGCSQIQTKIEKDKIYKLDMSIQNKEYFGNGVLVLPAKPLYTIDFSTEQKIDWISFKTCSRTVTAEDLRVGINKKEFRINYAPNEIELKGLCPAYIVALNEKGMQSLGYIDFEDSSATLPAVSICGSITESTNGVSICQEKIGGIQRIRFKVDTIVSPDSGCEIGSDRGIEYTYRVNRGTCVYAFMEIAFPNRIHRHTVIGYEDLQNRI